MVRNPYQTTKWRNDTAAVQTFKIHGNHGYKLENMERGIKAEPVQTVILRPGQTIELPSHLDRAIQTIGSCEQGCLNTYCTGDHGGIVIGGMAPMLTRVGRTVPVQLARDIDPAEANKRYRSALIAWEKQKELAEQSAMADAAKQGNFAGADLAEREARAATEAEQVAARARRDPSGIVIEGADDAADPEAEITEAEVAARVEANRGRGARGPRRE